MPMPYDYSSFFGGAGMSPFSASSMNPMALAAMRRMGGQGATPGMTPGGPAIPGVPNLASAMPSPMAMGAGLQPQQTDPMQALSMLQAFDPEKIKKMLAGFGLGGGVMPMPTNGVSNDYYNAGDAMASAWG